MAAIAIPQKGPLVRAFFVAKVYGCKGGATVVVLAETPWRASLSGGLTQPLFVRTDALWRMGLLLHAGALLGGYNDCKIRAL